MNSIQKQQLEALLLPHSAVVSSSTTVMINKKQFQNVAGWLGLLLGLLLGAADMGGQVFLMKGGPPSIATFVSFTALWSMGVSTIVCTIIGLIRRMIRLVHHDSDLTDCFDKPCLLWGVVGVTLGYTILDALLLPVQEFLGSVALMVGAIGMFKVLSACFTKQWLGRRRNADVQGEMNEDTCPLMIV